MKNQEVQKIIGKKVLIFKWRNSIPKIEMVGTIIESKESKLDYCDGELENYIFVATDRMGKIYQGRFLLGRIYTDEYCFMELKDFKQYCEEKIKKIAESKEKEIETFKGILKNFDVLLNNEIFELQESIKQLKEIV